MKKISLLLLAILFSLSIHTQAQNSNLEFGIKAGANYSKFTADFPAEVRDHVEYQRKPGFYLGAFLSKALSEKLYFQPELHFALLRTDFLIKGVQMYDPDAGHNVFDIETNISESAIAVPLLMRYYLTGSFFLDAGPQAGFIIDRSEKIENDPFKEPGNTGTTLDHDYDKFDLSLSLGTGYKLSRDFIINGRYSFGVIERDNSIKSSVFSLGLEYKL
jgi:hypothetical protein